MNQIESDLLQSLGKYCFDNPRVGFLTMHLLIDALEGSKFESSHEEFMSGLRSLANSIEGIDDPDEFVVFNPDDFDDSVDDADDVDDAGCDYCDECCCGCDCDCDESQEYSCDDDNDFPCCVQPVVVIL